MKGLVLTIVTCSLFSCSPHLPVPDIGTPERNVVEITDLFQSGHERFAAAVETDSLANQVWLGRREQIVMILIDIEWEDGDREQAQQSGIMMDNGNFILTAGHGFVIDDGEILDIRATLVSGEEVDLTALGFRYDKEQVPPEDWALLKPSRTLPYIEYFATKAPKDRRKMMLLGYPGALGLDIEGQVVHVQESDSPAVYPLGMICIHHVVDQHTLFPGAGTIPLRGISGAPIFDRNGEIMGMFSSIGRRRTIKGWDYIFSMSNIPWNTLTTMSLK